MSVWAGGTGKHPKSSVFIPEHLPGVFLSLGGSQGTLFISAEQIIFHIIFRTTGG